MSLSPMMQQYMQTKEKYSDCILFYRLGDFYEMFFDDAIKASGLLNLTLTGRDCGLDERAPMCGVPHHAADQYIAKLVQLGEKVAICEQMTPPQAKGIVERDVVRVVSAGTLIDESQLDERKNNYIVSIYKNNDSYGLSYADITTGDFFTSEFSGKAAFEQVLDKAVKLSSAEIICNAQMHGIAKDLPLVIHNVLPKFTLFAEWAFTINSAKKTLAQQFGVLNLSAFGLEDKPQAVSSAGGLVEYLKETQKHALINIKKISFVDDKNYLVIDKTAAANLELVASLRDGKEYGTLLWLMDKTSTGMGARALRGMLLNPLQSIDQINYRLDGVEELYKNNLIRSGIAQSLKSMRDIERLSGKVSNRNITPKDCKLIGCSLAVIPSVKMQLCGLGSKILKDIDRDLIDLSDIVRLIDRAFTDNPPASAKDGDFIKEGYNKELDEIREIGNSGVHFINELETAEREKTGIKNLKIGFNRVFGYYIEITNSFKDRVPYGYTRKQTLANAERYITGELKELEDKILGSKERSLELELALFNDIKEFLAQNLTKLQSVAKAACLLDCIVAFASLARENNYCRPELLEKNKNLSIVEGRHPVVESISKEKFVPNDTFLNNSDNRTMIITGPNMAGKSTYLRQVALITLMAHMGSFVPAKSAEIPITDRIFTRIGASDNLINDQSTFMVEMTEVASILYSSSESSLLILDEVGRGTSTYDGLSIAWSIIEFITGNIKAKTLFATHYHELTELEGKIDGIKNYKITVKEYNNTIIFLRKIMRGGANKSFGIEVASLAGVPKTVTARAKEILKRLESSDIAATYKDVDAAPDIPVSRVESILKDININGISPMEAFNILHDLIGQVKE